MNNKEEIKDPYDYVTVVSGLPRSGTSMLMQMLDAGGMPLVVDHRRKPDDDNPRGYYEYEPVKRLKSDDRSWLSDCRGKAIKIISPLLEYLPEDNRYRIVLLKREIDEVLASQKTMMERAGQCDTGPRDSVLATFFEKHLRYIEEWMKSRPMVLDYLFVHFIDVINNPGATAKMVNRFLDQRLDEAEMAAVVGRFLYRHRKGDPRIVREAGE